MMGTYSYNLLSQTKVRRNIMEKQNVSKGISPLAWVIIAILVLGAGTLIFWLIIMMLFK